MFKFFFPENRTVYEVKRKKYCRAEQTTDDNNVYALCILDT